MSRSTEQEIQSTMQSLGFDDFSFVELKEPVSKAFYEEWLKNQFQGEMGYLQDSEQVRKQPHEHYPSMQTLIIAIAKYFPHPETQPETLKQLKVAHYAQGKDYHFWFREKLQKAIEKLQVTFPKENFLAFTDAVPLLERDHAYQAGLGWVGKNTCLIQRKNGSLFFIGEILTSLKTHPTDITPTPDHCGKCKACIEACPTEALIEPRVMDARKCISYWNIESKEVPPPAFREKMGDWFFGCDICQTVCPWNIKIHKMTENFNHDRPRQESDLAQELETILKSSNKELMRKFKNSPLTRAGGRGLKRNALIVIANKKLTSLKPEVEKYRDHQQLGELASWTLGQLG